MADGWFLCCLSLDTIDLGKFRSVYKDFKTNCLNLIFVQKGVTDSAVRDLFSMKSSGYQFYMSFYEIYGGRCFDLLNSNKKVTILEDGNNNVSFN